MWDLDQKGKIMTIQKAIEPPDIMARKGSGKPLTMLTAWDYLMAKILDESGIDIVLVGDSLSMVFQGNKTTLPVTLDEMIYHAKAVVRGVKRALVVTDMPFMSYQVSVEDAIRNAGRVLKETGAGAVKIEGGRAYADTVKALTNAGIPVMGHIGLQPQSYHTSGGYKLQGKSIAQARILISDAEAMADAGAFSLVLEKIPAQLSEKITSKIPIPTISIGAGPKCDGQVLVTADILGLFEEFKPKFVRRFANLADEARKGIRNYIKDVEEGTFPDLETESFLSKDEEFLKELEKL